MGITATSDLTQTGMTPVLRAQHPLYVEWKPIWDKLGWVVTGAGPFLDGTALYAHVREYADYTSTNPTTPTKKLRTRRAMARYENYAEYLITQISGALFRQAPQRVVQGTTGESVKEHPYLDWLEDVDGCGTAMTPYLREAWQCAATFGHCFLVMDVSEAGVPYLRTFAPPDAPDWLLNEAGALESVKFVEVVTRRSLLDVESGITYQYRFLDGESVAVYQQDGTVSLGQQSHQFGMLPVTVLYAKRDKLGRFIGQPAIGRPESFYDLYNIDSEIRELQRNQVFGILNVPLGTGDQSVSVTDVKAMMGVVTGSDSVLFTPTPAAFISPDPKNIDTYQAERERILRNIYRLATVPWEADSRDAESADSAKIKRDEFGQQLSQYADELQRTENRLVDLWFRATYGAKAGPTQAENANVLVRYPDKFDADTIADWAAQAGLLTAGGFPYEVKQAWQQRAVQGLLPDATPSEIEELQGVIEQAEDPAAQQQRLLEQAVKGGMVKPRPAMPKTAA